MMNSNNINEARIDCTGSYKIPYTLCGWRRQSISFSFFKLSSSNRRILAFMVEASWFRPDTCCKMDEQDCIVDIYWYKHD